MGQTATVPLFKTRVIGDLAQIPTSSILGPGGAYVIGGVATAIRAVATGAFIGVKG